MWHIKSTVVWYPHWRCDEQRTGRNFKGNCVRTEWARRFLSIRCFVVESINWIYQLQIRRSRLESNHWMLAAIFIIRCTIRITIRFTIRFIIHTVNSQSLIGGFVWVRRAAMRVFSWLIGQLVAVVVAVAFTCNKIKQFKRLICTDENLDEQLK